MQRCWLASCPDRTAVKRAVLVVIWPGADGLGDLFMQTISFILALASKAGIDGQFLLEFHPDPFDDHGVCFKGRFWY